MGRSHQTLNITIGEHALNQVMVMGRSHQTLNITIGEHALNQVMVMGRSHQTLNITIGEHALNQVQSFKCLGSTVNEQSRYTRRRDQEQDRQI